MSQQKTSKQVYEQEKQRKQDKQKITAFRKHRQNKKFAWQERE